MWVTIWGQSWAYTPQIVDVQRSCFPCYIDLVIMNYWSVFCWVVLASLLISILGANIEQTLSQSVLLSLLDGITSAKLYCIHHRRHCFIIAKSYYLSGKIGKIKTTYVGVFLWQWLRVRKLGCKLAATFELKHENKDADINAFKKYRWYYFSFWF